MELISKTDAKAKGLQNFFTGHPCGRGHIAERYVSTGNCSACAKSYSRKRNQELGRLGRRKYILKTKYNLTYEAFEAMLKAQGNRCGCCGGPFSETPFVDHCHTTGKTRELLCRGCNTALGHARDKVERLEKMIAYLKKHKG